jgi:hypothetical protein
VTTESRLGQWRAAWVGLACALALHVTDEALTGFLPVYNGIVRTIRKRYGWAPFPPLHPSSLPRRSLCS